MNLPISDIAPTIQAGFPFRKRVPASDLGSVYVIQGKDIRQDHTVDVSGLVRVEPQHGFDRCQVFPGDVLIMNRGVRNYATLVREPFDDRVIAVATFFILRVDTNRVDPEYLTWYLNLPEVQRTLGEKSRGTSIPHLTVQALGDLEVPVLSLEHQTAILRAAVLIDHDLQLATELAAQRRELLFASLREITRSKSHALNDE
ncbi:hypothetical protein ASA1KI_21390 [Opitutales bacterium ASA1]|uniref:restriction endonuclease subunit S n=1 Tax=Congregicoccus parvus TaxID=3081749 RepID=UPI002B2EB471|nr:hypothetical protein ASA1KI_21390 [Opitutales bacterium ASA1]